MSRTFSGREFIQALEKGKFGAPLMLEGMVRPSGTDEGEILFSNGVSCDNWISLPVELISSVEVLKMVACCDHQHPYVQLTLADPAADDPTGRFYAEVLQSAVRHGAKIAHHTDDCRCNDGDTTQSPNLHFPEDVYPIDEATLGCPFGTKRLTCRGRTFCVPYHYRCCGSTACGYPYRCCKGRCIPANQFCN